MPELGYLQLFATAAAIFAGTVATFATVESFISKHAKKDLSDYLKSADFPSMSSKLPALTADIFETIFGKYHFTVKTFLRSVFISVAVLCIMLVFAAVGEVFKLTRPDKPTILEAIVYLGKDRGFAVASAVWLVWSLVIDYINLYKTRVSMRILNARRLAAGKSAFLFELNVILYDLAAGVLVFTLAFSVFFISIQQRYVR